MPEPIWRAPPVVAGGASPLWLGPAGELVTRCTALPCEPCGPVPTTRWVRATRCACAPPGAWPTHAWLRESEYLVLRAQGSCPTGRLIGAGGGAIVCYEVLPGAVVAEFPEPGPADRLAGFGVGGCCACCPGCAKSPVQFPQQVGCRFPGPTYVEGTACCALTDVVAVSGYALHELFVLADGPCGAAGVGVERRTETWWQCTLTGCTGVSRERRWRFFTAGCPLDLDRVRSHATGPALCAEPGRILEPAGTPDWSTIALGFSIECGTCGTPTGGGASGPGGAQWSGTWFRSVAGGGCVRAGRAMGVLGRGPLPASACKGSCVGAVLGPAIPPPPPLPGGGNVAPPGRAFVAAGGLLVPSRRVIVDLGGAAMGDGPRASGGCSGCGADGGL